MTIIKIDKEQDTRMAANHESLHVSRKLLNITPSMTGRLVTHANINLFPRMTVEGSLALPSRHA